MVVLVILTATVARQKLDLMLSNVLQSRLQLPFKCLTFFGLRVNPWPQSKNRLSKMDNFILWRNQITDVIVKSAKSKSKQPLSYSCVSMHSIPSAAAGA